MTILERVNQSPYKAMYGRVVRFLRSKQQLTLRTLGEQIGFSHAFLRKVEMGQTAINAKVFNKINSALELELIYDEALERDFFYWYEQYHLSNLYLDTLGKQEAYEQLRSNREQHQNSLWMDQYYIVELGAYIAKPFSDEANIHQIFNDLSNIESLMDSKTLQIFLIYKGGYYFRINDMKRNRHTFIQAYEIGSNGRYGALTLFLLGLSYAQTFSVHKSNRLLSRALEMFKAQNNEMRVFATQIYMEFNHVLIGHYDQSEEMLKWGLDTAKRYELDGFANAIQIYLVIYYVKNQQYSHAKEQFETLNIKHLNDLFYEAYVNYKLNDYEGVLAAVDKAKPYIKKVHQHEFVDYYGILAVQAQAEASLDDAEIEGLLKSFFDEAKQQNAYYQIDVAYDMYTEYLRRHRKYKSAYFLTLDMVKLTKKSFEL